MKKTSKRKTSAKNTEINPAHPLDWDAVLQDLSGLQQLNGMEHELLRNLQKGIKRLQRSSRPKSPGES